MKIQDEDLRQDLSCKKRWNKLLEKFKFLGEKEMCYRDPNLMDNELNGQDWLKENVIDEIKRKKLSI